MNRELVQLTPHDEHNQELESNVHPPDWQNPTPTQPYHLVVIGVALNGEAEAWPISVLNYHEIINDRLGDIRYKQVSGHATRRLVPRMGYGQIVCRS